MFNDIVRLIINNIMITKTTRGKIIATDVTNASYTYYDTSLPFVTPYYVT